MEASYRELMDYLQVTNTGEYVELPQIVVIGDTSSGKSSLLSSLAQVQFPVNDVLTTRCPIRLKLERQLSVATTTARININWHSKTRQHPNLPHWPEKLLTSIEDVTAAIEEAQAAILSCDDNLVAWDIIELHITGPNMIDLTVVDLPGLVQATGKGESEAVIPQINRLISDYIKNERCVILAVQPANVDFHNSKSLALALTVDPTRERTIPVITKPDLIDPGSEHGVLELLLGNKTGAYSLGFHMVKCRGKQAMSVGVTLAQAEMDEKQFFGNMDPWKKLDVMYYGVDTLRQKLCGMLIRMIENSIPSILKEISVKLCAATHEQAKMGPSPEHVEDKKKIWHDAEQTILQCIQAELDGTRRLHAAKRSATSRPSDPIAADRKIKGSFSASEYSESTWCAKSHYLYKQYGNNILNSTLATITKIAVGTQVAVHFANGDVGEGVVIKIWDGGDYVFVKPTGSSAGDDRYFSERDKKLVVPPAAGNLAMPVEGDVHEDPDGYAFVIRHVKHGQTKATLSKTCIDAQASTVSMPPPSGRLSTLASVASQKELSACTEYHCMVDMFAAFRIGDVKRSSEWLERPIQQSLTHDLPCFLNANVFNSIVRGIIDSEWKPLTLQLCCTVFDLLNEVCQRVVVNCVPHQYSRLARTIQLAVETILVESRAYCQQEILALLAHESSPFTQNQTLSHTVTTNRLAAIKKRVSGAVTSLFAQDSKVMVMSSLAKELSPMKRPQYKSAPRGNGTPLAPGKTTPPNGCSMEIDNASAASLSDELFIAAITDAIDTAFQNYGSQRPERLLADDMLVILDAYGGIASQRLADNIPMLLVSECREAFLKIQAKLRNFSDEQLRELIWEEEIAATKRKRIEKAIETLQNAEAAIRNMLITGRELRNNAN
jgi:GTPase SAR1 family protein